MHSSVESCVTSTVVSHQKAIPFIMLTNDLGAPYRLSGVGLTTELINVHLKRVIIPLHAGDASLYLRNHIQGILCLPGCETTMLGRTRTAYPPPSPVPLDGLAAATTTTDPAVRAEEIGGPADPRPPPSPATDFSRVDFFRPPASGEGAAEAPAAAAPDLLPPRPPSAPLVVVRGQPCALHLLRGGIRCQWGHHARTTASTLFRRYLDRHRELLRDGDVGERPPDDDDDRAVLRLPRKSPSRGFPADHGILRGEADPGASCYSLMSSSTFSDSASVATEALREAEESEALYGQTLNCVSDYIPVSCPTPPPGVGGGSPTAKALDGLADTEDGKLHDLAGSPTNEEMFTCWASNSCSNMPIFTLPLTGFALVAVSTHMVRRVCLDPNATEEELDKICDEFLCDLKDLPAMPSAQQHKIYEDGMKLMVAASFLQL